MAAMIALSHTPLWPAGHLALKGGDWLLVRPSPISNDASWAASLKLPISPLEGEMAGRPEGGITTPDVSTQNDQAPS
jgi:hypothetical protein